MATESSESGGVMKGSMDAKIRLQTISACALCEVLTALGDNSPELWLPTLRRYSIIQCLLTSVTLLIEGGRGGIEAVKATFRLFIVLTRTTQVVN